jgi:hypothetical protein
MLNPAATSQHAVFVRHHFNAHIKVTSLSQTLAGIEHRRHRTTLSVHTHINPTSALVKERTPPPGGLRASNR